MRIAINCRSILLSQRTGIGRYTYNLLESLGEIDQVNEYVLHAPKGLFDFKRRLPDFSSYDNLKRYPDYFKGGVGRCDIYHFPCPDKISSHGGKLIVTIHDLIYKTYPQSHNQETIDLTHRHMQEIVKKADRIICTSNATRQDLHRFFDFSKERSSVVYNGVDHNMFYKLDEAQRQRAQGLLAQKGIDFPFLLFVGTLEPRKNLAGLLEAFAILRQKGKFKGKLVVVGMKGWGTQAIEPLIVRLNLKDDVILMGFVDDEELCFLYNLAEIFIFPSFYEGFGFPIVEAFCCGAAVVTSNTSSCAEIAGDAAVKADPASIPQIADAIGQLLEDQALNQAFRQKSIKKAQEFSFLKTARETLSIYQQLGR